MFPVYGFLTAVVENVEVIVTPIEPIIEGPVVDGPFIDGPGGTNPNVVVDFTETVVNEAPEIMEKVINAVGDVLNFAGTLIDKIVDNPLLLFLLAAGIVPIGLTVFEQLKRTAKG